MTYKLHKTLDTSGWDKEVEDDDSVLGVYGAVTKERQRIADILASEDDLREEYSLEDIQTSNAAWLLCEASRTIARRAKVRDLPSGERSMLRAVEAYKALKGCALGSELDGWLFMCCLKLARATAGDPCKDDYVDLAGYAALAAECLGNKQGG